MVAAEYPRMPDTKPPATDAACLQPHLNLRSVRAIGYDMDYTLVHYNVDEWERRAYEHVRERFAAVGWPVAELRFDPRLVIRGLILDVERGNVVKANRFGFIKRRRTAPAPCLRRAARGLLADHRRSVRAALGVPQHAVLALGGCMYSKLVRSSSRPGSSPRAPDGLPRALPHVKDKLDRTHVEGELKAEVIADPERYVWLDAETPLALLDQKHAGKRLLLITNSEWAYTRR